MRAFLLTFLIAGTLYGGKQDLSFEELKKMAGDFDPNQIVSKQQTLEQLRLSITRWEENTRDLSPDTRKRIRSVLSIDEILSEMQSGETTASSLKEYSKSFFDGHDGLERVEFLQLRAELERAAGSLRVVEQSDLEEAFHQQVEALIAVQNDPAELGPRLEWIKESHQAPRLTQYFQQRYRHPNFVVDIHSNFIREQLSTVEKEIHETEQSQHQILGATVTGDSQMSGKVQARFVPHSSPAQFEISIKEGKIVSPLSTARKGPARVYTRGSTDVLYAQQLAYWDGTRFIALAPQVRTQTHTSILGAQAVRKNGKKAFSGSIRRMALRQANRKKSKAESEASRIADNKIKQQMNEEVQSLIDKANEQYTDYFKNTLLRVGMYPEAISTSSDLDFVRLGMLNQGPGMLAAPSAAPMVTNKEYDLIFHIHESFFLGGMDRYASARTWTDEFIANFQKQLTGTNSAPYLIGTRARWDMQLDWDRPISAHFRPSGLQFEFEVQTFKIDGHEYRNPFRVSAIFEPTIEDGQLIFVQKGSPTLTWLEQAPEAAVVDFLKESFQGFFQPILHMDGLAPPAGGQWGSMSQIKVTHFEANESGWASVHMVDTSRD